MENELSPICAEKHANMLSCISQQADGDSSLSLLSTADTTPWVQDRHRYTRAVKAIKGLQRFS